MMAGTKRVAVGALHFFVEGKEEPVPETGDYAILVDRFRQPRLIWRTIAPLSTVTHDFVSRDCTDGGDRDEWLCRIGADMARQARAYKFEMHPHIETVFEDLEIVWPGDLARRIRLVAAHLDRCYTLLRRLEEQQKIVSRQEAILSRIQAAVLTVTASLRIGFCNQAAEALLRRGDGLGIKEGLLVAHGLPRLAALVAAACDPIKPCSGRVVTIQRNSGEPPYHVCILPLRRGNALIGLHCAAQAVIFVDDPSQAR